MLSLRLSRHADRRAQQRGVTHAVLNDLLAFGDIEVPVGSGCVALSISRNRLQDLSVRGALQTNPDKLSCLAMVWSETREEVVTVITGRSSRMRRYRRA